MDMMNIGTRVYFGRTHGEKTLGEVVKINRTTVKVKQLEARGTMRDYVVGTIWKVPFRLVSPATVTGTVGEAPTAVPGPPKPARAPETILVDIRRCYIGLDPENLHCDGEISLSAARKRAATLRARLKALFAEYGRPVSETEAFGVTK